MTSASGGRPVHPDAGDDGVLRIVLTGGPGGGKTTAADLFRREIGERVVVVPESATILFAGGFPRVPEPFARFAAVISRTAQRGGTVLIPAFAVDRTEVVLLHLRRLIGEGLIPPLPVYVDSPMALAALRVYRRAVERGGPEIDPELVGGDDPFDSGHVVEVRDVAASRALADLRMPAIIVSASGMASGGRVVHHLARLAPDHRNAVVLVGFQAPGTRGRLLADGARQIKMLGRYVRVRAEVVDLAAFSVHADQAELVGWLDTATSPPDAVYVVHGEQAPAAALRDLVDGRDGWVAVVPRHGERVRLD